MKHRNISIGVEAHRFVRKMRGGAQAHLIESTDGSSYIVKFTNNPQHPLTLMNEWITSAILRHLDISTPDTAVVNISPDFIRNNPEVYIQHRSRRLFPACGSHFGSRSSGPMVVYDILPNAILGSVVNLSDFCGALVVDKWLGNTDCRQAVFVRAQGASSQPSFITKMIDNGYVFDGGNWQFEDSPLRGPYVGKVYQHVKSLEDFEPWLAAVTTFSADILQEAFRVMPSSWRCGKTEAAFEMLVGELMRRRRRVGDLILACRIQSFDRFPNWFCRAENSP